MPGINHENRVSILDMTSHRYVHTYIHSWAIKTRPEYFKSTDRLYFNSISVRKDEESYIPSRDAPTSAFPRDSQPLYLCKFLHDLKPEKTHLMAVPES